MGCCSKDSREDGSNETPRKAKLQRRGSFLGDTGESFAEPRTVRTGIADVTLRTNKVRTTKYTMLSFLPMNLWEQFHRAAYVYFLILVILNWLPQLEVFAPIASMLPLIAVLAFGAAKDAYEDRRRYKQDQQTNAQKCHRFSSKEEWVEIESGHVHVGDVLKVDKDRAVPADMLLLTSASDNATVNIDTSGLDGESNLKPRGPYGKIPARGTEIRCGDNLPSLAQFDATMDAVEENEEYICPLTMLLPRGSVIRSPAWCVGVVLYTGKDTKILLGTTRPEPKVSKLESGMNVHVTVLCIVLAMLCLACGFGAWDFWHQTPQVWLSAAEQADFYTTVAGESVKAALMSVIMLQVMVPIALYVSLDVVKLCHAYLMQQDLSFWCDEQEQGVSVRTLNIAEDLGVLGHVFSDKTGTLTANRMTFRKAHICNAADDPLLAEAQSLSPTGKPPEPIVIAEGDAAVTLRLISGRLYLSGGAAPAAAAAAGPSDADIIINELNRPEYGSPVESSTSNSPQGQSPTPSVPAGSGKQVRAINWDGALLEFEGPGIRVPLPVGPERARMLVAIRAVAEAAEVDCHIAEHHFDGEARCFFWTCLSLCHTARPSQDGDFEGESADEVALLRAAATYGQRLTRRTSRLAPGSPRGHDRFCVTTADGSEGMWRLLATLHFTPERKRMSVIVEQPGAQGYWVICKGADSAMEPLCQCRQYSWSRLADVVEDFAGRGLRTLVVACRPIQKEHAMRAEKLLKNCNDVEVLDDVASTVETDMTVIGITGVEDALRPGTRYAVAALRSARIGVWVLTGDKVGTAQHIAVTSGLVPRKGKVVTLDDAWWYQGDVVQRLNALQGNCNAIAMTGDNYAHYAASPAGIRSRFPQPAHDGQPNKGEQVAGAMLDLCDHGVCVLVCRATPAQKQDVVILFRRLRKGTVCAAIGDGANDVAMLRKAHIGIGITGNEGRQAELASDYAIPVFAGIVPLLLVQGHWQYHRIGWMIMYFLYKNALFAFILFWYQIHSGWSQTTAIDEWSLMLYNMIYTVFPGVVNAVLDQDCTRPVLEALPRLHAGPADRTYGHTRFFLAMCDTLWQSLCIHYAPLLALDQYAALHEIGVLQCAAIVVVVNTVPLIDAEYIPLTSFTTSIGSTMSYFGFTFLVHELMGTTMPYGFAAREAFGSVFGWLVLIVTVAACLLPRIAFQLVMLHWFPTDRDLARKQYRAGRIAPFTVDGDGDAGPAPEAEGTEGSPNQSYVTNSP
eukprot:TRINITY_DN46846_c0_g1_i1.p1 TRINITY_DN46846_c0_g1~~TRINITY_DN46846_c0_g1_i1.p1  ORF type:complete len:1242 (+),score=317.73 TRINITY_DN46846_c0_g1_i1:77-3802(+)